MTKNTPLNPHGQPLRRFNRRTNTERDVIEFMGLAKGVLCDGVVNADEVEYVMRWLKGHPDAIEGWPLCALVERVTEVCADGTVDREETEDLAELLKSLVGGIAGLYSTESAATELPIDRPAPQICWADSEFVFTGKFAWGTRAACEAATMSRGGTCSDRITASTKYVVIGTFMSRDWASTTYGRKIESAVQARDSGRPLAIISEDYWASMLPAAAKVAGNTITKDQLTFNVLGLAGEPINITFWRDGKKLIAECCCDEWSELIYCRHALRLLDGSLHLDPSFESDAIEDLNILSRGSNVAAATKRSIAMWYQ